ncbi:hypothetical protein QRD02_01780 [Aequorivita sp. SDUM287046]|uniref:Chain length determinant protein n=1 Tax=Aequorivita aurantiaca TaxID=3053356 RepID=A0ABT8DJB8_9FLAO|nr:hypothetical protein [Aequorivita aurantiaca]MDN3723097.1 hypothetical protein [Aequorivita aurantiaca]
MAQNNHDEIDLGYVFKKISAFFRSFVKLIFLVVAFFVKYIIVLIILILIGVGIGYYVDKNAVKVYDNHLIVIPNFESTQYLYEKVEALSSKLKDRDLDFLKTTIGTHYTELVNLEAKPIVDLFNFAATSRERVDLFKVLTDKQDIPDYVKDPQNFQYFKYHHITVKIKGKAHSKEIVAAIEKYLNDNEHFGEYMKVNRESTQFRIETSKKTISQIDSILNSAASIDKGNSNLPSVMVSDNSQLNDVIQSKDRMLYNLLKLNMQKVDEQSIIKIAAINYNVSDFSRFRLNNKVFYPLMLVLLFSGFFFLRHLYRKMKQIAETDEN